MKIHICASNVARCCERWEVWLQKFVDKGKNVLLKSVTGRYDSQHELSEYNDDWCRVARVGDGSLLRLGYTQRKEMWD